MAWKIITAPFRIVWLRYALLLLFVGGLIGLAFLLQDLPSPSRLKSSENFAVSSQIFDRNGSLLYEIYGDEHRIPIKISDLPPYVYQASIAVEDQYFYKHWGFDIFGILRAARTNITGGD
jgi:membrane carboxypeptidase/penicillin-binding protein